MKVTNFPMRNQDLAEKLWVGRNAQNRDESCGEKLAEARRNMRQ
jgi:hypothetical protein